MLLLEKKNEEVRWFEKTLGWWQFLIRW